MDPLTHAASGAVAMLACPKRPATAWALPLAALACASPDIDLAFIRTPLDFLLLHRGITHSFAAAPLLGLILALLCLPLWRKSTPGRWPFLLVWLFCTGMVLLHIWLDVVTTYGTMVFLPFSQYRVRLNSIYIIDFLVTIPLLWAIWRWRARPGLAALCLAWIFIYPAIGIGLNAWHTEQRMAALAREERDTGDLYVLPDAFAPFFWRVIFEENGPDGPGVREQSLDVLGRPRSPENIYAAAPRSLARKLATDSVAADVFFHFSLLPVMSGLRQGDAPPDASGSDVLLMFHDLRFGSGLEFVRKLLAMRPNADIPFQLLVELRPPPSAKDWPPEPDDLAGMDTGRIRLRFSDSGRDSQWHQPLPPGQPTLTRWLLGLRP